MRGITFTMAPGEAWAVVGASGAGKSTLLTLILGLEAPTEGRIHLAGAPWSPGPERARRQLRPMVQAVFQEALASLPPHRTGWELLMEPLAVWHRGDAASRRAAARRQAERVKVPLPLLDQRPSTWTGGMAQRIALARALMLAPPLLVLDEPFAGLDATLAGHLLALLHALKVEGTGLLLVSHDLLAVRDLCDQVLVLDQGQASGCGTAAELFGQPPHPCLRRLLAATLPGEAG